MDRRLTQKQETFCLKYFELGNASEAAIQAGYSRRSIRNIASVNLTKANIQARLEELRKKVEDVSVASVLERKQLLTDIIRTTPGDILEIGPSGKDVDIKPQALKSLAVSHIRTEQIAIGKMPWRITHVSLTDKVRAAAELNKMERIYEAEGSMVIQNQILTINVTSEKAKDLTQRLIKGERTGGDDGH